METTQSLETLCHFYYNGVYVGRLVNANQPTLLALAPGDSEGVNESEVDYGTDNIDDIYSDFEEEIEDAISDYDMLEEFMQVPSYDENAGFEVLG